MIRFRLEEITSLFSSSTTILITLIFFFKLNFKVLRQLLFYMKSIANNWTKNTQSKNIEAV